MFNQVIIVDNENKALSYSCADAIRSKGFEVVTITKSPEALCNLMNHRKGFTQTIFLINYDMQMIGGLSVLAHLIQSTIKHGGSILASQDDEIKFAQGFNDSFIESCDCNLLTVNRFDENMIISSLEELRDLSLRIEGLTSS